MVNIKKKTKKNKKKKLVVACILSSLSCEMVIRILGKMTDVLVSLSIIYMAFTHKTLRKDALSNLSLITYYQYQNYASQIKT